MIMDYGFVHPEHELTDFVLSYIDVDDRCVAITYLLNARLANWDANLADERMVDVIYAGFQKQERLKNFT